MRLQFTVLFWHKVEMVAMERMAIAFLAAPVFSCTMEAMEAEAVPAEI
tara:strand:- start:98 stop:241 length:144 start_codon:yes stop_codon:yes gene_type:complete